MNTVSVHDRIKSLLEETSNAFGEYGQMNADYAEFASLSLSEFKNLLGSPYLTRNQLRRLLRAGMNMHRQSAPESCWASFMAEHMASVSNCNGSAGTAVSYNQIQDGKASA